MATNFEMSVVSTLQNRMIFHNQDPHNGGFGLFNLPEEIIYNILSYLNYHETSEIRSVSMTVYIVSDPVLPNPALA